MLSGTAFWFAFATEAAEGIAVAAAQHQARNAPQLTCGAVATALRAHYWIAAALPRGGPLSLTKSHEGFAKCHFVGPQLCGDLCCCCCAKMCVARAPLVAAALLLALLRRCCRRRCERVPLSSSPLEGAAAS